MELCNIGSSGILPSRPISGLRFSPEFPAKSRLPRLKRLNLEKNLVINRASGFDESCSGNGFYNLPSRVFMEEAIGAEYGEGFETFRPDGPLKVDVDFLNDRMQEGFLQRIRYAMKPDEAFGLIFSWDNVVADTRTLKMNAWKQLASEEGKDIPEDGGVQRSMLYAGADHVLRKVLFWEEEGNELERLKSRLSQLYYENLLKLTAPVEGLKDWLDAVYRARIPCAIVSCLNRRNLVEALQQMGLNKYFQTRNATATPPLLATQKSNGDLGSKRPLPDTTFEIGRHPIDFQHLVHLLRNCESIKQGRSIHGKLAKSCLDDVGDKKVIAFNHIAHMYAKHLDFDAARQVFDEMPHRNVFSWTIMISGLTDDGFYLEAFRFFCEMQNSGIQPDKFTFSSVFKLCLGLGSIDLGKMVHAQILKTGYSSNVFVGTSLLNMYAKFGEINEAVRVFNTMNEPSTVSWNAMLSGYVTSDLHLEAFNHFLKMKSQFGSTPDAVAFISVLKAIGKLNDVGKGREVHSYVTELGLESNVQVGTALISMYSKCGCLNDARLVFDSNFTKCRENLPWNAMISGYSQCGHSKEALELFTKMCLNNVKLDVYTLASTVSAVAASECLQFVTEVHAMVVKLGYDLQCSSVSNALVDAYSRCGSLEYAEMVLETSEERGLVFWTTMVTAHVKCSEEHKALQLFSQMREEGFAPNEFTFSSILVGVSSLCLLEYGQQIHGLLLKAGLASHDCVEGALIDMYAKCGSIIDAEKVFKDITEPDVVSWTAIISGFAQHGLANEAVTAFRKMEKSGVNANRVTLLCLLFACSHAGMVEEGLGYFHSMKERYGLEPDMEHYTCIIDLLGRVGRLDDAEEFIKNMPFEPSYMIWQALLGACRVHGNVQLGERAARKIISVIPDDSAAYVLLSNTYIERGSLGDGLTLRNVMRDRGVKKEPGVSWITINGVVHKFFSGDQQHPDKDKIYAKLKDLRKKMKDMGYAPDLKYFLQQIE